MTTGIWFGILICVAIWGSLVYNLIHVALQEKNGKKAPLYSERALKEMKELGITPLTEDEEWG